MLSSPNNNIIQCERYAAAKAITTAISTFFGVQISVLKSELKTTQKVQHL